MLNSQKCLKNLKFSPQDTFSRDSTIVAKKLFSFFVRNILNVSVRATYGIFLEKKEHSIHGIKTV